MGIDIWRQGELVPVPHEHRKMTMHIFYIVYTPVHELFFFFFSNPVEAQTTAQSDFIGSKTYTV